MNHGLDMAVRVSFVALELGKAGDCRYVHCCKRQHHPERCQLARLNKGVLTFPLPVKRVVVRFLLVFAVQAEEIKVVRREARGKSEPPNESVGRFPAEC